MKIVYRFLCFIAIFGICDSADCQSKDSITVNIFLLEDCKICQYYVPTLKSLFEEFAYERIGFIGLFPNRYSSENNIEAFKKKHDIPFHLQREFFQTKTEKFNVNVTPEVVVYNETKQSIIYKGRIDNGYVKLGQRRRVVTQNELRDVLRALINNQEVKIENREAIGCLITKI
ncbi:MAG: hypothetical protein HKO66_07670 [Saprospiraceae bacterium]|nr:hypothetical protein [Bacteroidia bacterium]NNE14354.1 hypothetical protein [Saprospiraceae bacterium]NNL92093.1 hypothetical protein [Saprospiraceae bacterium]